jgi:hypothetical protein
MKRSMMRPKTQLRLLWHSAAVRSKNSIWRGVSVNEVVGLLRRCSVAISTPLTHHNTTNLIILQYPTTLI